MIMQSSWKTYLKVLFSVLQSIVGKHPKFYSEQSLLGVNKSLAALG